MESESSIVVTIKNSSNKVDNIRKAGSNVNAQAALERKMRALQKAQDRVQKGIAKEKKLLDGRIRYYEKERAAKSFGSTRGSSHVTEYNPKTGQVRTWGESYDHNGKVNRISPKMIDGQNLIVQHYPPTGKEIEYFRFLEESFE